MIFFFSKLLWHYIKFEPYYEIVVLNPIQIKRCKNIVYYKLVGHILISCAKGKFCHKTSVFYNLNVCCQQ